MSIWGRSLLTSIFCLKRKIVIRIEFGETDLFAHKCCRISFLVIILILFPVDSLEAKSEKSLFSIVVRETAEFPNTITPSSW